MSSAITFKDILGAVAKDDEAARYKNFVENLGVLVNTTYYEAGDGTAAHVAAKYGNLGIIKFALETDPSILGHRDVGDNTIFFTAIENGHIDIVKYLVEKHGLDGSERDTRPNGNTGIHQSCEHGHLAILKYFIEERNGYVDIANNFGQPPIFLAVRKKHYPIVMYLAEEQNANLNLFDHHQNNILFVAVDADDLGIMKYILKKMNVNIDIEHKNIFGDTLVSRAAYLGGYEILKFLLGQKHANVNARDISNKTALHSAARKNNFKVCKYLLKYGADIFAKGEDGKLPVNEATNTRLITFLEDEAKVRERRSVPDFPQFPNSQTSPIPGLQTQNISGLPDPTKRLDGGSVVPSNNRASFQFLSLLITGNMITRWQGRDQVHEKISSPPELLQSRMDPMAVEASLELYVD